MNEDKIFLGNTPANTRAFLLSELKLLRQKYKRLVVPCCGQMAIPLIAVKAGWEPEQIFASDVSFFSTVLAYGINGIPVDDLNIEIDGKPWTSLEGYAELLYWLKYYTATNQSRHYFQEVYICEMMERKEAHIQKIKESLTKFGCLRGMHYRLCDLFDEVAEALPDAKTIIWVNPPFYRLGYQRMYDTGGLIKWAEPRFKEFIPNDHHDELREGAIDSPALFLWYRYNVLSPQDKGYAVFADQKGRNRWDYTLANRPSELQRMIAAKKEDKVNMHYDVLPGEYEITVNSVIQFKEVTEPVALYYRDLFIHRLGVTSSKWSFLMLIDGYVAGAVGMAYSFRSTGDKVYKEFEYDVEEGWGMTAHSVRHPKINRLLMMLIKCNQFLKRFDFFYNTAVGITTTCLCKYPEMKINRGIYKLVSRVKLADGPFKLRYRADRTDQDYKGVLQEWMTRFN